MIPFIDYTTLVAKLKLGLTGLATFKGRARFHLTDSNGNRLNRVRREDWQRLIDEQPVMLEMSRSEAGEIKTTVKYDFSHREET